MRSLRGNGKEHRGRRYVRACSALGGNHAGAKACTTACTGYRVGWYPMTEVVQARKRYRDHRQLSGIHQRLDTHRARLSRHIETLRTRRAAQKKVIDAVCASGMFCEGAAASAQSDPTPAQTKLSPTSTRNSVLRSLLPYVYLFLLCVVAALLTGLMIDAVVVVSRKSAREAPLLTSRESEFVGMASPNPLLL